MIMKINLNMELLDKHININEKYINKSQFPLSSSNKVWGLNIANVIKNKSKLFSLLQKKTVDNKNDTIKKIGKSVW